MATPDDGSKVQDASNETSQTSNVSATNAITSEDILNPLFLLRKLDHTDRVRAVQGDMYVSVDINTR